MQALIYMDLLTIKCLYNKAAIVTKMLLTLKKRHDAVDKRLSEQQFLKSNMTNFAV